MAASISDLESQQATLRRLRAKKAGLTTAAKYGPEHMKEVGSRGGKALIEKHPERRTSDWGKYLARCRAAKRAQRLEEKE